MSNSWFRLYHEFSTDPKVQMLSEADQRRYVMILCLRCCNGIETLQDEEVAFQLRISIEEWYETKQRLMQRGLVDDVCHPTAWDKRQFSSDSSTARVAKHRDKKKKACNVTETPPDTDTDTDTEEENPPNPPGGNGARDVHDDGFDAFWHAYPRKVAKSAAAKAWAKLKAKPDLQDAVMAGLDRAKASRQWSKDGGAFIPHASTWLNQRRWEDEPDGGSGDGSDQSMRDFLREQKEMLASMGLPL
jgi:hypothetical protein